MFATTMLLSIILGFCAFAFAESFLDSFVDLSLCPGFSSAFLAFSPPLALSAPLADVWTDVAGFYSSLVSTTVTVIRPTFEVCRTIGVYIVSVGLAVLGFAVSFCLFVLVLELAQTVLGQIPAEHRLLRWVEKDIQRQLKALQRQEELAAASLLTHLAIIDKIDDTNDELLREIREAEAIIKTKNHPW